MRASAIMCLALALSVGPAWAQEPTRCRVLCTPEFKVEPTITFTSLFNSPRVIFDAGVPARDQRETDFEVILSVGLPTRIWWLDFTVAGTWTMQALGRSRWCSLFPSRPFRSHTDSDATRDAGGRPNRSYRIGTTIMFSAVELRRPNMMTIAIGA